MRVGRMESGRACVGMHGEGMAGAISGRGCVARACLQSEPRVGCEERRVEHVGGRGHVSGADRAVAPPQSEHGAQQPGVRARRQRARPQEHVEGDQPWVGRDEQLRLGHARLPLLRTQPRRSAGGGGRGGRCGARVRHRRRRARPPIAPMQPSADALQREPRAIGEPGEQLDDVLQRVLGHLLELLVSLVRG